MEIDYQKLKERFMKAILDSSKYRVENPSCCGIAYRQGIEMCLLLLEEEMVEREEEDMSRYGTGALEVIDSND